MQSANGDPREVNGVDKRNILRLDWSDVTHEVNRLASYLKANREVPHTIIGVTRGGLIPAVMLSHQIGVSRVETVICQLRDGYSGLSTINPKWNGRGVLVLDDLWDSGRTFITLHDLMPSANFAALYHKDPEARITLEWPGQAVASDQWLIFPWER